MTDGRFLLPEDEVKRERVRDARSNYLSALKDIAQRVVAGEAKESDLIYRVGHAAGTYEADRNHIDRKEIAELRPADMPRTLEIQPLDENATSEQHELVREVERVLSVVDIVLNRREKSRNRLKFLKRMLRKAKEGEHDLQASTGPALEQADNRKMYLRRLKEIVDEGLSFPKAAPDALRRLEGYKNIFVAQEADYIKNQYVMTLGLWAASVAFVLALLAVVLQAFGAKFGATDCAFRTIQSFLYLSIGACVGTWASFSLRRVVLTFDDLILLEPDRLYPLGRIIFVAILANVVGLILQLGFLSLKISDAQVTPKTGFGMAVLIGLFCGIAERSLSGAVSGRAEDFVRGLGLSKKGEK